MTANLKRIAFGLQWNCVHHTEDIRKKKKRKTTHRLFQHVMQNFRSNIVWVALFEELKKVCEEQDGRIAFEWPVSKQLPTECHCWLLLNILPSYKSTFKHSLPKLLNFHWQVGSLKMLHDRPGDYFSTIIFLSTLFILIISYWNKRIWFSSCIQWLFVMQMRWINGIYRDSCSTSKSLLWIWS